MFNQSPEIELQLRALWMLYQINAADEEFLLKQLSHPNEHVRAWAVRLSWDRSDPSPVAIQRFSQLAMQEKSALVRLYLAAALQRVPVERR